jgi:hypothetical protein
MTERNFYEASLYPEILRRFPPRKRTEISVRKSFDTSEKQFKSVEMNPISNENETSTFEIWTAERPDELIAGVTTKLPICQYDLDNREDKIISPTSNNSPRNSTSNLWRSPRELAISSDDEMTSNLRTPSSLVFFGSHSDRFRTKLSPSTDRSSDRVKKSLSDDDFEILHEENANLVSLRQLDREARKKLSDPLTFDCGPVKRSAEITTHPARSDLEVTADLSSKSPPLSVRFHLEMISREKAETTSDLAQSSPKINRLRRPARTSSEQLGAEDQAKIDLNYLRQNSLLLFPTILLNPTKTVPQREDKTHSDHTKTQFSPSLSTASLGSVFVRTSRRGEIGPLSTKVVSSGLDPKMSAKMSAKMSSCHVEQSKTFLDLPKTPSSSLSSDIDPNRALSETLSDQEEISSDLARFVSVKTFPELLTGIFSSVSLKEMILRSGETSNTIKSRDTLTEPNVPKMVNRLRRSSPLKPNDKHAAKNPEVKSPKLSDLEFTQKTNRHTEYELTGLKSKSAKTRRSSQKSSRKKVFESSSLKYSLTLSTSKIPQLGNAARRSSRRHVRGRNRTLELTTTRDRSISRRILQPQNKPVLPHSSRHFGPNEYELRQTESLTARALVLKTENNRISGRKTTGESASVVNDSNSFQKEEEISRSPLSVTETPKLSEPPETSQTFQLSETLQLPKIPHSPETLQALEPPQLSETPQLFKIPQSPETPQTVETPQLLETPQLPEASHFSSRNSFIPQQVPLNEPPVQIENSLAMERSSSVLQGVSKNTEASADVDVNPFKTRSSRSSKKNIQTLDSPDRKDSLRNHQNVQEHHKSDVLSSQINTTHF